MSDEAKIKELFRQADDTYRVCSSCRCVPAVALAVHGCGGVSALLLGESAGQFVDVPADPDQLSVWESDERSGDWYAFWDGDLPLDTAPSLSDTERSE